MLNAIAAGLCFLGSAFLYGSASKAEKRAAEIAQIQSTECGKVVAGHRTEVKGSVKALTSLSVPERPGECVYYRLERKQLQTKTTHDSKGRPMVTEQWVVIEARSQAQRFLVEDASGGVTVDLAGADVDAPLVVDKTDQGPANSVSAGGFTLSLGSGRPIETKVWALVPGQPVYVLGNAEAEGSKVVLKSAEDKLLVSYKSEDELLRNARQDSSFSKAVSVVLFVAGLAAFFLIKG